MWFYFCLGGFTVQSLVAIEYLLVNENFCTSSPHIFFLKSYSIFFPLSLKVIRYFKVFSFTKYVEFRYFYYSFVCVCYLCFSFIVLSLCPSSARTGGTFNLIWPLLPPSDIKQQHMAERNGQVNLGSKYRCAIGRKLGRHTYWYIFYSNDNISSSHGE